MEMAVMLSAGSGTVSVLLVLLAAMGIALGLVALTGIHK